MSITAWIVWWSVVVVSGLTLAFAALAIKKIVSSIDESEG